MIALSKVRHVDPFFTSSLDFSDLNNAEKLTRFLSGLMQIRCIASTFSAFHETPSSNEFSFATNFISLIETKNAKNNR